MSLTNYVLNTLIVLSYLLIGEVFAQNLDGSNDNNSSDLKLSALKSADVDKDGDKVLDFLFAAANDNRAIVQEFINQGIDVDVVDSYGETALYRAASQGKNGVINLLLDANADPNKKNEKGWSPLHAAVYNRYPETVRLLAKNPNVNVNIKIDKTDRTPLHIAAILSENDSVRFLIGAGADFRLKDYKGNTIIDIAKDNNDQNLLNQIKEIIKLRKELFRAVRSSQEDIVRDLSNVISLRTLNDSGDTPLHVAAKLLDDEMVKVITQLDWFTTKIVNKDGKLAADIAFDKQDAVLNILDNLKSPADELNQKIDGDEESEDSVLYGEESTEYDDAQLDALLNELLGGELLDEQYGEVYGDVDSGEGEYGQGKSTGEYGE